MSRYRIEVIHEESDVCIGVADVSLAHRPVKADVKIHCEYALTVDVHIDMTPTDDPPGHRLGEC